MDNAARDKLIEVWKVLEVLTVSMDRIGSYEAFHGHDAGKDATSAFMGPITNRKIAHARRLLVEVLEAESPEIAEQLDALVEDSREVPYWDGPDPYPLDKSDSTGG